MRVWQAYLGDVLAGRREATATLTLPEAVGNATVTIQDVQYACAMVRAAGRRHARAVPGREGGRVGRVGIGTVPPGLCNVQRPKAVRQLRRRSTTQAGAHQGKPRTRGRHIRRIARLPAARTPSCCRTHAPKH